MKDAVKISDQRSGQHGVPVLFLKMVKKDNHVATVQIKLQNEF